MDGCPRCTRSGRRCFGRCCGRRRCCALHTGWDVPFVVRDARVVAIGRKKSRRLSISWMGGRLAVEHYGMTGWDSLQERGEDKGALVRASGDVLSRWQTLGVKRHLLSFLRCFDLWGTAAANWWEARLMIMRYRACMSPSPSFRTCCRVLFWCFVGMAADELLQRCRRVHCPRRSWPNRRGDRSRHCAVRKRHCRLL